MSKDSRHDGRRRGAGQHRLGPRISQGADGRERSGSNSSGSSHGGGKSKNGSITSLKASFQRSNSHDKVRRIVAEEGRAARNLIAWSVPLESKEEEVKSKGNSSGSSRFQRINSGQQKNKKQNAGVDIKGAAGALLDKGPEKSPTKVRQPRKVDLRARYWAFLFENLRRAVDEIYVTCESDQSVLECKEVLMMLDNYVRDFKALIDWIQLQEKLEKTDAQNRPTSLAWEVRKMSPGRHVMQSPTSDRVVPSTGARRALNFGGPPSTLAAARLSHTGPSWADRVKCTKFDNSNSQPNASPAEKPGKKDAEGWETVHRGRTAKPRSAAIVAKVSPVVAQVNPKQDSAKCNRSLVVPQEEQHPRPELPSVKEVIQADTGQPVSAEPDPLVKVKHPDNEGIMEPPAENVQDSGQCANATCEDEPPPVASLTPSQASEGIPSAPTFPPTDTDVLLAVPSVAITSHTDPPQEEGISNPVSCGDTGAKGGASKGMATSASGQAETPMAVVKLESVLDPTELSTVSAERWRSSRREGLRGREYPRVRRRLNKVDFRKPQDQKRGRAAKLYVVVL